MTNIATSTSTCNFDDFFSTDIVHVLIPSTIIITSIGTSTSTTCNFGNKWNSHVDHGYIEIFGIQENNSGHTTSNFYACLVMCIVKCSNLYDQL